MEKKVKETRICLICDDEFIPCKPTSTTCSAACRNANNSLKSTEKRAATLRARGDASGKWYRKVDGVHEHITVMEKKLGRKLVKGEIVHHIDHNKRNNDPGNLELKPSQAEHAKEHMIDYWRRGPFVESRKGV